MPEDLDALARVLTQADTDRSVDIDALADLTDDQVDYLARAGELDDPDSDGLEGRCV